MLIPIVVPDHPHSAFAGDVDHGLVHHVRCPRLLRARHLGHRLIAMEPDAAEAYLVAGFVPCSACLAPYIDVWRDWHAW